MKLALVQMSMTESMDENYQKSLQLYEKAADLGADLVLFPEIQLTPFFPQYEGRDASGFAIDASSPYWKGFSEACARRGVAAVPNFYYKENGRCYDANIFFDGKGEVLGIQKMVHIAQAKQFYEQDYYAPSDDGFHMWETPWGNLSIVICFDRHYPESIRTCALKGADLVLVPTANTADEPMEMFEWEIRVQAFQNSVAVAMCNRVGQEGDMLFSGESLVAAPDGSLIAKAGAGEEILLADIDLPKSRELRAKKPYTSLRRPECYL